MVTSRGSRRPPVAERRYRLPVAAAFLRGLLLAATAHAQPAPSLLFWISSQVPVEPPPPPALGVLRPQEIPPGGVSGEGRVVPRTTFDPAKPGEGTRLFRLANYLHRTTRTGLVAQQLLFKPG